MSPSDVPDPISPTSASAGLPSDPAYSTLSACLNGPLNRKTVSSGTVISLADLRSPSSDLPPTPKTPDFGGENQTSHRADGTYVLPVHPLSDHIKNDVNRRKEQNRNAQRAFRERKEKRLQDLQGRIETLVAKQQPLAEENRCLKQLVHQLQAENRDLNAYKTAFNLIASDSLPNSASPLPPEMQSQPPPTINTSNGYPESTPLLQFSSLRHTAMDRNNLDTCSQASIASQSSGTDSPFPHPTPGGTSQPMLLSVEYPDMTSIMPPLAGEGHGSDKMGSVKMCDFSNTTYLEQAQPQPKNSYIFGTSSDVSGSLPASEAPSGSTIHELQNWYNEINFPGSK
ncbi:hypothetical protein PGT21_011297 [Puccinia graminis f. sp. tritici]|nr:hypothetical protein PGT21_011297 [Puccinia graminis f. sp. tritici]